MRRHVNKLRAHTSVLLFFLALLMADSSAFALLNNAQLISVTITNNTPIAPRTIFTQIWTMKNTGTATWKTNTSGCTLNMVGTDCLGALPVCTNSSSTFFLPMAVLNTNQSVAPNFEASFTMMFIAPEAAGSYTDYFQLNSKTNFGPIVTVQIVVQPGGNTNQYDRCRTISYANNYAGKIVTDGYYWTNGSDFGFYGPGSNLPPASHLAGGLGDDCAHFVSCCVGSEPSLHGGGLTITNRVPPTYGEPGAAHIVTNLIGTGFAVEVAYGTNLSDLGKLSPGDIIGWNWEGDTNIDDLDHVTLYLGNYLVASHAQCVLDVSGTTWFQGTEDWVWHLIHILDAPTVNIMPQGQNLVLSWTTNWTSVGYGLYSSPSVSPNATWSQVAANESNASTNGTIFYLTNAISSGPAFYRLMLP
jgi:hypothetical protein